MKRTKKGLYTSIQLTPRARDALKAKKRRGESYESYLKRMGVI